MIKEIRDDLFNTSDRIIAHQVNCQGVMASGIADTIKTRFPATFQKYLDHCRYNQYAHRPTNYMLGDCLISYEDDLIIAHLFGQNYYGKDGSRYTDYLALETALKKLFEFMKKEDMRSVSMPKIGCGLGGGNWGYVKSLIQKHLPIGFQCNVYDNK